MITTTMPATITAAELLGDIHPFFGHPGGAYPEPDEAISKLRAVLMTLMACQDETTSEFTIPPGAVAWNLILAFDLVEEIDRRVSKFGDNVSASWREAVRRVDACCVVKGAAGDRQACL